MLLSSGERTLAAHMAEGGKAPKAGQSVRLLDIPVAGKHGAFDALHELQSGRELSDTLKTMCAKDYGHIGIAFVEHVIADKRDLGAWLADVQAVPAFTSTHSLEGRAAATFALCAMAGELAIEWGLLPWQEGEALNAAVWGFDQWRNARGTGQTETTHILRSVSDFIAKHGDSRFSALVDSNAQVRDRAGWWKDAPSNDGRVFLFTPAGLREAAHGYDFKRALDALESSGWIVERDHDKRTKKVRVAGRSLSLYAVLPADMEAAS